MTKEDLFQVCKSGSKFGVGGRVEVNPLIQIFLSTIFSHEPTELSSHALSCT